LKLCIILLLLIFKKETNGPKRKRVMSPTNHQFPFWKNPKEPNADSLCMLLANLSKSDSLSRLLGFKRAPVPALSPSPLALDQLTHLFNRGANRGYNPNADYDYLAYLFADLAKVCSSCPTVFSL
jgi:hypothetical protein